MPYVCKDISGQKFNSWTVVRRDTESSGRHARWVCKCECGAERSVIAASLKNGSSKSCGCYSYKKDLPIKEVTEKFCPKCGETKSADSFAQNKARATPGRAGLAAYCKDCSNKYHKENKYDHDRWHSNKEREYQRHKDFIAKNLEAQRARMARKGKLYIQNNRAKVNAYNRARGKWNFVAKWADKKAMEVVYQKASEWSKILGEPIEVDHIVPLRGKTVCGLHCEANLQLLAKELNHKKRHFVWPDMP